MTPEEYAAAEHLALIKVDVDTALLRRAHQEYRGPEGWAQAMRAGVWTTWDELLGFVRDHRALLDLHGHTRDDAPEGARPVSLRFSAVPDAVGEWEGEPTGP
ncbi:hypothetical protein ACFSL4_22645 [Streptomyces caeni]|uniref:Uncharacterized protein n=1 Tax=Streptomyces caeni TaxID=2307231 RepID=A0ABW4IWE0_9ACTN